MGIARLFQTIIMRLSILPIGEEDGENKNHPTNIDFNPPVRPTAGLRAGAGQLQG